MRAPDPPEQGAEAPDWFYVPVVPGCVVKQTAIQTIAVSSVFLDPKLDVLTLGFLRVFCTRAGGGNHQENRIPIPDDLFRSRQLIMTDKLGEI